MYVTKYGNIWILFIRWGSRLLSCPAWKGTIIQWSPLLLWTHQSHLSMQCICHIIADFKIFISKLHMHLLSEILIWGPMEILIWGPMEEVVSCCPCCVNVVN